MSHDHAVVLEDLIILLSDGSRITLRRNDEDVLVSTAFEPAEARGGELPAGRLLVGFGPWPSWSANIQNRTATLPDEESGLFEPERLFVLREQYAFFEADDASAKPLSFGPIEKVWWRGTEHIVQARQLSGRH